MDVVARGFEEQVHQAGIMHIMHGQSESVPGMTRLAQPGDLKAPLPVVGGEGGGTGACCSSEAIAKNTFDTVVAARLRKIRQMVDVKIET